MINKVVLLRSISPVTVLFQRSLLSKVSHSLTCVEDFGVAEVVVGCLAGDRVTVVTEVVDGLTDDAVDEGGSEVVTTGFVVVVVVVSNFSFTIDSYNDIVTCNT